MMNDLEKLVEEARARFDAVADEAGLARRMPHSHGPGTTGHE
mgnify:CR=1 FL=1